MAVSPNSPATIFHSVVTRLKVRQLALLQAIHKHRSLNRVALELGLSQPAITKALREVEDVFAAQLFERSKQGLKPTAVGEALLAQAAQWLADLEGTTRAMVAIQAGRRGRIRLGFTHYVPQALLSAALRHLLDAVP